MSTIASSGHETAEPSLPTREVEVLHETQTGLIERIFSLVDAGATDFGEVETTWPIEHYFDPQRFEAERTMLEAYPVPIAASSQLQRPGDYVTERAWGKPVVVVRSESGGLNAFFNVCRHRGTELISAPCGNGLRRFVCPYHAWTYSLDGELTNVPDQSGSFPGLDRGERGLRRLTVEERHGLVWVSPAGENGDAMVRAFLGPELDDEFESAGFGRYVYYREESWAGKYNWKCAVESFLENYHFAVLHRDSTNPIFIHNLGVYDRLNLHFRAIAPKKSIRDLRDLDPSEWELRPHATILYVVFPFSIFFVEKSHFSLLQIIPEEVDLCRVRAIHCVQHERLSLRPFYEANIGLFMAAIREDLGICESMQRGFRSGANTEVVFGRNEVGCHAYRACIEEQLAAAAVNGGGR